MTLAVHNALQVHAQNNGWRIYPELKPYVGEYLCDFMLFEKGHGCRIACESQWTNVRGHHLADIEWAFEKLLGVKSDIELFIFEGSEDDWLAVQSKYLVNYAQLTTEKVFVLLRLEHGKFSKSWWLPHKNGRQTDLYCSDLSSCGGTS
jgi:hypothetical protein